MSKTIILTEDEVRDSAKVILGFNKREKGIKQGTGQITTFNQLGFKGYYDKPDGWYLPDNRTLPAIILETKSSKEDLLEDKWVDELAKNCKIALTQFKDVIGILYNGIDIRVFKNNIEVVPTAAALQEKTYYLTLATQNTIDKQRIYCLTKKINDSLHINFGIKNLYHRMIFTACALVGTRFGALLAKGMNFTVMKSSILSALEAPLNESRKLNIKLDTVVRELNKPQTMNDIVRGLLAEQERQAQESITLNLLLREKRQTDNALENVMKAIEQGIISNTTNKRLHELESKQEELERQILIEKSKQSVKISEREIRTFYENALRLEPKLLIDTLIKEILLYDDRIEIYFNSPIRTSPDDENRGFSFYRGTQRRTFKDPHKSEWTRIILEVVMKL